MKILKREDLKDLIGGKVETIGSQDCATTKSCSYTQSGGATVSGTCNINSRGVCYCGSASSAAVGLSGCYDA